MKWEEPLSELVWVVAYWCFPVGSKASCGSPSSRRQWVSSALASSPPAGRRALILDAILDRDFLYLVLDDFLNES